MTLGIDEHVGADNSYMSGVRDDWALFSIVRRD